METIAIAAIYGCFTAFIWWAMDFMLADFLNVTRSNYGEVGLAATSGTWWALNIYRH